MKGLDEKSTREGDFVLDLCAGTCATVKARMLIDAHRECAECDWEWIILRVAKPEPLLTFFSQVLSPNSEFSEMKK